MTHAASDAGASGSWLGVRVDLEPPAEALLTGCIAEWIERMRGRRILGRWFFLWYAEDGFHLRLRLQPASRRRRPRGREELAAALAELERGHEHERRLRLSPQIYDRTALAFGETRESVLAELLHAATSDLAIALLTSGNERFGGIDSARRWVLTASAVSVLLRRSVPEAELDAALTAWMTFAANAARRYTGLELHEDVLEADGGDRRDLGVTALRAVMPSLEAALDAHGAARRAAALLRRVRERGERGRFVATHALHLFCNEMGLGFAAEHDICRALRSLWRADAANAENAANAVSAATAARPSS